MTALPPVSYYGQQYRTYGTGCAPSYANNRFGTQYRRPACGASFAGYGRGERITVTAR